MRQKTNPYSDLPKEAFWRSGVAEAGVFGLSGLWRSRWRLPQDARFSTYGSCFAQHISRALVERGANWLNAEPAPRRTPPDLARAYNYGIFSARTGNVYTAAQLRLLLQLATGEVAPDAPEVWEENGRHFDSIRPAIEPGGFDSAREAILSRVSMARAVARSVREADVFVFTLGLTEGWENAQTHQPYALCPGTVAGAFDPERHVFRNHGVARVDADMRASLALLRGLNPSIRVLLTVSPVPLTATASGQHVLVATSYSKSVLRAVAGDLQAADEGVDYFPSYEIITGAPTRGAFYAPNMRSVEPVGVAQVMGHFFAGLRLDGAKAHEGSAPGPDEAAVEAAMAAEELVCEEMVLGAFNEH